MFSRYVYQPIPTKVEADGDFVPAADERESCKAQYRRSKIEPILIILIVSSMIVASFVAGRHSTHVEGSLPSWASSVHRAPVEYIRQEWHYSPEFGAAPTSDNETEAIWNDLIPMGQGFVRESPHVKHPSAISVVHQLHCLYSIRRRIFRQEPDAKIAGLNMEHMQPPHLRHCFDYLRQALLCNADPTLEPWNDKLGGVTGWGFARVCRNYDQLKEWAEARRTNNRTGFIEVGAKHHHKHKASKAMGEA